MSLKKIWAQVKLLQTFTWSNCWALHCSQAQWETIFKEQQTSGLAILMIIENIRSTSGFYAIRKKHDITPNNFVRTKIT